MSRQPHEKRSAYRVRATSEEAEIFVATDQGPVAATLEDLTARGCGFTLTPPAGLTLAEDQELMLRLLVGGPLMPQLFVRATIRSIRPTDGEGAVRCGVLFGDTERLYGQLKVPQWRFFNRRQAFRVPPADERGRPLRARFVIPGEDEPRSLQIHDLSSSGISTDLRPANDVEFPRHLPVRVRFNLPKVEEEIDVRVLFVHRTMVDGRIRTGFRIDEQRTERFESQTEEILRYVLERQRQLLLAATAKGS